MLQGEELMVEQDGQLEKEARLRGALHVSFYSLSSRESPFEEEAV